MWDSDNIPLVTRIVAGDGITLSYVKNSDNEAVWTASVDETWLSTNIQSSFDSDALVRISAIEAKLGIGASAATPTPSPTTGSTVKISSASPVLTVDTTITWNVQGVDRDNIVTRTVVLSAGTLVETGLRMIARSVTSNAMASKYINGFTTSARTGTIVWNSGFEDFAFSISAASTVDNVTFTVTQ